MRNDVSLARVTVEIAGRIDSDEVVTPLDNVQQVIRVDAGAFLGMIKEVRHITGEDGSIIGRLLNVDVPSAEVDGFIERAQRRGAYAKLALV